MFVPAARERVRIKGRSEVFLVLAVNREEELAYVVDLNLDSGDVDSVSFDRLEHAGPADASLIPNAAD